MARHDVEGTLKGPVAVAVDENGLGPRLGPLVVTAVTARCDDDRALHCAFSRPGRAFAARLGDSKKLVGHGDTALGEAWARALAVRLGLPASSPDDLVHALSADHRDELRSRCPDAHAGQCWATEGEAFTAEARLVGAVAKDLARLDARGVHVAQVEIAVVCTERLNRAVAAGRSRFVVDLHAMERLVLSARARAGDDVVATCGKVGGYDRYGDSFGPLSGFLHAVVEEGRARSEYQFPGVGRVAFVRDADEGSLLVGMASLVGKWARDLLMDRVVRWHRRGDEALPPASGYHDPVTARFIDATALTRKANGLPDDCFERRAIGGAAPTSSSPRARSEQAPSRARARSAGTRGASRSSRPS